MGDPGERSWTWGTVAPDAWFTDRSAESLVVRGYLTARANVPEVPPEGASDAMWTYDLQQPDLIFVVRHGSFEIAQSVTMLHVGRGVIPQGIGETTMAPPGTYLVLVAHVPAPIDEISQTQERDAMARLDTAAGIFAALVSPNTIYQVAFEFLQSAGCGRTSVLGPPILNPTVAPYADLTGIGMKRIKVALDAVGSAPEKVRDRARLSLRWYAQAHAERNRVDQFLKFWIALEALAMGGNGSPAPLSKLIGEAYGHDPPQPWAESMFAINGLAQLRNAIVHCGKQPMPHGNLLRLVAALYEDALFGLLKLPCERRAERVLPEGLPFVLSRWRNNGSIATAYVEKKPRAEESKPEEGVSSPSPGRPA